MSGGAVHIFALDHPHLARTLSGKLMKRQDELRKQLGHGNAEHWADYQHRVGVITGMQEAIDLCNEANKELGV